MPVDKIQANPDAMVYLLAVDIFINPGIVFSGIYQVVEQEWTDWHSLNGIPKRS